MSCFLCDVHFCGGCAEKEQNGSSNGDSKAEHGAGTVWEQEEGERAALVNGEENGEMLNENEQCKMTNEEGRMNNAE